MWILPNIATPPISKPPTIATVKRSVLLISSIDWLSPNGNNKPFEPAKSGTGVPTTIRSPLVSIPRLISSMPCNTCALAKASICTSARLALAVNQRLGLSPASTTSVLYAIAISISPSTKVASPAESSAAKFCPPTNSISADISSYEGSEFCTSVRTDRVCAARCSKKISPETSMISSTTALA